jgi:hypothetical protein
MRIASLSDGRKVYIRRTDEPVRMHQKLHPAVRPMALEVPALGVVRECSTHVNVAPDCLTGKSDRPDSLHFKNEKERRTIGSLQVTSPLSSLTSTLTPYQLSVRSKDLEPSVGLNLSYSRLNPYPIYRIPSNSLRDALRAASAVADASGLASHGELLSRARYRDSVVVVGYGQEASRGDVASERRGMG